MKIGIIVGSIREGRSGSAVGAWVLEQAQSWQKDKGEDVEFELIELADFNVPLLTSQTVPGAANRHYDNDQVTAWGQKIDSLDSFIYVTPEYNHGVPGAFKNAFDSIYPEWVNKAVSFVSYGADGGVRAVEAWRVVVANALMHATRAVVSLQMFTDFTDGEFTPQERRSGELGSMLDQLVPLAKATQTLR